MHPEPLLGAVADPRLQDRIDLAHQGRGIGVTLAAAWQDDRREDRDPEMRAGEPLDPERYYVAIEAQRQKAEGGGSHRWAAEERYRDSIIHLLVGE